MIYTLEFKKSIVEKYQQQISVTELSREFEIPRSSIYNWIDLYLEKPIQEINVSKKQYNSLIINMNRIKEEHKIMKKVFASWVACYKWRSLLPRMLQMTVTINCIRIALYVVIEGRFYKFDM